MKHSRGLVVVIMVCALVATAGRAAAEPAIWVVRGPHAAVYLFGTIHALAKDQSWHSTKIDAAIQQSQTLFLEVSNIDDVAAVQPLMMQFGFDPDHPLSSKLTSDQLAKL